MQFVTFVVFLSLKSFHVDGVFGTSVSKEKCHEYQSLVNGPYKSAVYNTDEDAVPKEFPFMAYIEMDRKTYINGILISENFVLALTHHDVTGKNVYLGAVRRPVTYQEEYYAESLQITKEFPHPQYSPLLPFYLKLLKLNRRVPFTRYILPACLPERDSPNSYRLLEVGWGHSDVRHTKRLHKVKMFAISRTLCNDRLKDLDIYKPYMEKIDEGVFFCGTTADDDRHLCDGFRGEAVMNGDRDLTVLGEVIGIVAAQCIGRYPNVFVRLSKSLDWIERVVWPEETAQKEIDVPSPPADLQGKNILFAITIIASSTVVVLGVIIIVTYYRIYAMKRRHRHILDRHFSRSRSHIPTRPANVVN